MFYQIMYYCMMLAFFKKKRNNTWLYFKPNVTVVEEMKGLYNGRFFFLIVYITRQSFYFWQSAYSFPLYVSF